jgi:hypothetical protein
MFVVLILTTMGLCWRFRYVNSSSMSSTWRIFSYKELHAATNGFSEENKLGEGGFGSVYWGKTSDGQQVINSLVMPRCCKLPS